MVVWIKKRNADIYVYIENAANLPICKYMNVIVHNYYAYSMHTAPLAALRNLSESSAVITLFSW